MGHLPAVQQQLSCARSLPLQPWGFKLADPPDNENVWVLGLDDGSSLYVLGGLVCVESALREGGD